jgi:hypothetical protein
MAAGGRLYRLRTLRRRETVRPFDNDAEYPAATGRLIRWLTFRYFSSLYSISVLIFQRLDLSVIPCWMLSTAVIAVSME